jgi:hypothetical protein
MRCLASQTAGQKPSSSHKMHQSGEAHLGPPNSQGRCSRLHRTLLLIKASQAPNLATAGMPSKLGPARRREAASQVSPTASNNNGSNPRQTFEEGVYWTPSNRNQSSNDRQLSTTGPND